jgi:DNA-binding XRE family transcriptional regulator
MAKERLVEERKLARLAKIFRKAAGKTKAQAARELGVAPPTLFGAEEQKELSLTKLRVRMIEAYSPYQVFGPIFMLKVKKGEPRMT